MAIHRRMAPRRFVEAVTLESDPEVRFYLRFSAQDADGLANFISPPAWGNLCQVAAGFIQDWEGVCAEDGTPVAFSLEEFYGRLMASERLEFAEAVVERVYGVGEGKKRGLEMKSDSATCPCSSPASPGSPTGAPNPSTCSSTPSSANTPA